MDTEGVIKYQNQFTAAAATARHYDFFKDLNEWRARLFRLGLIGQDPQRYGGYGFGNISHRMFGRQFLVSGSQTGSLPALDSRHYTQVIAADTQRNQLISRGPMQPSSEALSHASVYAAVPSCCCVIHVHSPAIWRHAVELGLPATPPQVQYGTPDMAQSIERLAWQAEAAGIRALSMGGHADGVLVFGPGLSIAGRRCLDLLSRAQALSTP